MTTTYTQGIGITTDGQKVDDFVLSTPDRVGVNIYRAGTNAEVSRFDIGPTFDSGILDGLHLAVDGCHVHDGKVHDSHTPSGPSFGTHGIYETSTMLVERVEAYHHPGGQCFSARWGNVHYRCHTHDSPYAYGVFDYSDGVRRPLVIREELSHGITDWWLYVDWSRYLPGERRRLAKPLSRLGIKLGDVVLSPNTIPVELDHCTIDLRACASPTPLDLSGDPGGSYIRNCVILWDKPSGWYRSPYRVDTQGTVILTSTAAALWLNADYTPKFVAGSPLIGKAVPSPLRTHGLYGDLPDVGRFQSGAPTSPTDFSAAAFGHWGKAQITYARWKTQYDNEYAIAQAFAAKPSTTLPAGVTSEIGRAVTNFVAQRAADGLGPIVLP